MELEHAYYGIARIAKYLPTADAERHLACCHTAGWHCCNSAYHMRYPEGVPCVLMIFTLRGRGWIRSGEKTWELPQDTLVTVPAGTAIEYGTAHTGEGKWEFYWLNLTGGDVFSAAQRIWTDGGAVHLCREPDFFRQSFSRLNEESCSRSSTEPQRSAWLQELFHRLVCECFFDAENEKGSSSKTAELIRQHIQQHYADRLTLEALCGEYYLSVNQIIRSFQKKTGYTPHEYLKRYRLLRACELLAGTGLPVSEVGAAVGYRNSSHFTAQFRACYGMTPTEYRSGGFFR
ncbi:MAG: helix-turn-helix transcriptional regulator [Oscillospiraceae bacterium]|nr:helix-turn-helix transcriptional regulator [Oscillospiraceae bacterium]